MAYYGQQQQQQPPYPGQGYPQQQGFQGPPGGQWPQQPQPQQQHQSYGQPSYSQGQGQGPPGGYGAPLAPQHGYGVPPSVPPGHPGQAGYSGNGYGQQQQHNSYGHQPPPPPPGSGMGGPGGYGYGQPAATATGQYQQAPMQQHQGYGAPPNAYGGLPHQPPPPSGPPPMNQQMQGPPLYLGTRLATDPFAQFAQVPPRLQHYDPSMDVDALRKATKGFGTNENALHRVLCVRSAEEMAVLDAAFKARYGKDLTSVIKSETSGYHERTLVALIAGPLDGDAELLHEACAGMGTKENLLTELIIGRTPSELAMLRAAYQRKYHKSMDQVIQGELSMKTRDAFNIALQGRWQDSGYPDPSMLSRDVHELGSALRHGFTDELLVCSILFSRSPAYIHALCPAFRQAHGKSLTSQIKTHFYGPNNHMRDALLYAVEGGKRDAQGIWRDAKMLEKAMAGAGTKDEQLIWRLVRAHWDRPRMEQIKHAYQARYKRSLVGRVKGETSRHYEDALVAIIEGR